MGSFSLVHWLIVILVIMLLFGRGRISDLMGDMAKGINSFKKGLADDDTTRAPPGYVQPPAPVYPPQPVYPPSQLAPPQPLATAPQPVPPVRDDAPRS
jgi:sec-independent protein translocase protein TatA